MKKHSPIIIHCLLTISLFFALDAISSAQNSMASKTQIAQEKARLNIYKAQFPNLKLAHKAAISFHHGLLEANYETGHMVFELDAKEKLQLEKFGFVLSPATEFIHKRNAMLDRLQASGPTISLLGTQAPRMQGLQEEAIPSYPCYETVEETFAAAQAFTSSYPNLATWTAVGKSWEKTNNLGGYDLNVLKLTNANISGPKPKLFIQSAMHAREYTTAPVVLQFARDLLAGYGNNADATWILDHHEIHMLLHVNPDGRKKAEQGLSWRKNTNQNYCGSTSNSRGADLNRNYTATWNSTNGSGSSGSQCNETYRGPSAASEPETKAVEAYVRSLWVDRRGPGQNDPAPSDTMGVHLDIHSYSQLVLWPYGNTSTPAPNGTAMQTLGRRIAYFNGYTPEQSVGLYPTDGTSDDVSYVELGIPSFTIELGTSFFESCSSFTSTTRPKNLPALWYVAKVLRAPYIMPGGPDVTTPSFNPNADSVAVPAGTTLSLSANANDTHFNQSNGTESTQNITAAEYYIDVPPWSSGATALALNPADGAFNSTTEGLSGTVNTSGLSNGKHMIFVRAKDASNVWGPVSAQFINIGSSSITPLSNGVPISGITLLASEQKMYSFNVPPPPPSGATNVSFATSGGSGNADLYVQLGSLPTTSSYLQKSAGTSNAESISLSNASSGTYYVMLNGSSASSGLQLVANASTSAGNVLTNGVPVTGIALATGASKVYTITVPAGRPSLTFKTTGGTGDADIYVKLGSAPTTTSYLQKSDGATTVETITVTNPAAGTYYLLVYSYANFSGVSLTASY